MKKKDSQMKKSGKQGAIDPEGWLPHLFHTFYSKVVDIGNWDPYQPDRLLEMPEDMTQEKGYPKYSSRLRTMIKKSQLSLFTCIRLFWEYFFITEITLLIGLLTGLIYPLILQAFINWFQKDEKINFQKFDPKKYEFAKISSGVWLVLALAGLNILKGLITARFVESVYKLKMITFNVIGSEIVLKVFRMDQRAATYLGTGKISVLVNTDVSKVVDSIFNTSNIIPDLMQILFSGTVLYLHLGSLVFIAVIIVGIFYFVQKLIFQKFQKLDSWRRVEIDRRSGMVAEIIDGIKSIKFNTSEDDLVEKMDLVRKREKRLLSGMSFRLGVSFFTTWAVPPLTGFFLFSICKIYFKTQISTGTLFAILLYLGRFGSALTYLVDAISSYYSALPSFERLDRALRLKENYTEKVDFEEFGEDETTQASPNRKKSDRNKKNQHDFDEEGQEDDDELERGSIAFDDFEASWEDLEIKNQLSGLLQLESNISENKKQQNHQKFTLNEKQSQSSPLQESLIGPSQFIEKSILNSITFSVAPGEFVALIGKVASGKTSLLRAIAGDLKTLSGSISKKGSIALVSQQPFLVKDTLKNNIIFGKEFNEERYEHVIKICQLENDLGSLPLGDLTEIRERGINLSGGQKQRIELARAVYSDSDIYLIDDCLSALDAHVGKAVLEEVILKELSGKTVVMASHHTHFLDKTDKVVLIDDGRVVFVKKYDKIQDIDDFRIFEKEVKREEKEGAGDDNDIEIAKKEGRMGLERGDNQFRVNLKKNPEIKEEQSKAAGKLIAEEKRFTGIVSPQSFTFYAKNGGLALTTTLATLFLASTALLMSLDWWAGKWFNGDYRLTNPEYSSIYFTLITAFILLSALKSKLYAKFSSQSSYRIFKKLLKNLLMMKLSFFDTTPSGVIINRAVEDMETVDFSFPKLVYTFLDLFSIFVLTYLLMIKISLLMIPVVLLCLLIHSFIFMRYLRASTELKRIFRVSRSPVLSTVAEMANGMSIIRLYGFEDSLQQKWRKYHDLTISAQIHEAYCLCWLSLWFYSSYSIMALALGLGVVYKKSTGMLTSASTVEIGLVFQYFISVICILFKTVVNLGSIMTEGCMVERVKEF